MSCIKNLFLFLQNQSQQKYFVCLILDLTGLRGRGQRGELAVDTSAVKLNKNLHIYLNLSSPFQRGFAMNS